MKKILFTCLFLLCGTLFAQNYYEIPYVGKRSKLTKLTTEEENKFIKENSIKRIYEVPKQGEKDHYGFFTEEENASLFWLDIYAELSAIYREEIPDEKGNKKLTVYRAMYDFKESTRLNLDENDSTERKCMGQIIYVPVNGKYVQYEKQIYFGTEFFLNRMSGTGVEANNVQFRICGDNVFAFYTRLSLEHWSKGYDEETYRFGIERINSNVICKTKLSNIMEKTQICEVKVDFPLIDKNNPFKYSVQNAFDGDPSTSYVEDTENDLFEINIDFKNYSSIQKNEIIDEIQLINGYASNKELYLLNNRINAIQYDWKNETTPILFHCKDNELNFQKISHFNSNPGWLWFEITAVYQGSKYSDTSLSELDIKFRKSGWLFGGN